MSFVAANRSLRVIDLCHGDHVAARTVVMQHKTQRPVQFEITPSTREAVDAWIRHAGLRSEDYLFPSRIHRRPHVDDALEMAEQTDV